MSGGRTRDSEQTPGALIEGKYRLLEELGRGGMGTVFRAHDVSLDRPAAIKFLRSDIETDEAFLERFRREAKAMAKVRHENVLQVFSQGTAANHSYIAMEFIKGQTVEDVLNGLSDRQSEMPLDTALRLIEQVTAGLDAIHRSGIIHRDIKPANIIMAEEDGRAVIMDFGIVRRVQSGELNVLDAPMGTPAYMAPEVILGRKLAAEDRHLTDIYALGVTIFEILTGLLPFDGESWVDVFDQHISTSPPAPSRTRPSLPRAIDELVLRCLEKEPERRYQSCGEIRDQIQKIRAELAKPLTARDSTVSAVRRISSMASSVPPPRSTVAPTGVRIVVAGRHSASRYALYPYITDVFPGCQFTAVKSNTAALEMARAAPPVLLVAPLDDPDLNGVELAASISGDPLLQSTHLVLTTKKITADELRMLESLGVFRVLLSPPEEGDIVALLEAVACRLPTGHSPAFGSAG